MLCKMNNGTFTGHRTNLTFFGDIIGDVTVAPYQCGYRIDKHPNSKVEKTHVEIGPIIMPDFSDEVDSNGIPLEADTSRIPLQDRTRLRGLELWKEFIMLEPNTNSFLKFANKYGLLGSTREMAIRTNHTVTSCDPLVDWFQHHSKLTLLRTVLMSDPECSDFVAMIEPIEKKYSKDVRHRFSEVVSQELKSLPDWIPENVVSGVMFRGSFIPSIWTFPAKSSSTAILRAAYDLLNLELSNHCRIEVRHKGKRNRTAIGDKIDFEERHEADGIYLITTTLAPNSLIGAMYIGVLLEICKYRTRRNVRPCQYCGKFLLNEHKRTKYCSPSCKKRAYRANRKAANSNV